ncbi:MAG TPA: peptide ABC transporter substrate-binding protein, partial [Chloroflexota bacterium]|nr:peptide ABC transporter substrate-binding protein [Chloroflexota bacterium]
MILRPMLLAVAVAALPALSGGLRGTAITQAAAPVHGGTAIDGFFEEPTSLLPNIGFYIAFSTMAQETIFSPLFYTDDHGATHPGLATKIPTMANGGISRDGLTYTFHLRPNLTWSDGQPLDARDVDYSWRLWTNKDVTVNSTVGFDHIQSATISPDHLSITFHLSAPYAPFVAVWTDQVMPLPAHILSKLAPKQISTSKYLFNPTVSSGPFVIQSRKSGQSIVETRNPHYYQPSKPYLDKLIFRIIPDEVALTNALRAHEIDCAWFLDIAQINTYKSISGYTFIPAPAPNFEQGLLNLQNPILQDVRVRQALEYGLNRQAMVQAIWHGTALLIASDQVPPAFSYDPSVTPYPYDPAKAARLLDAAGWKMGSGGVRYKNGKPLTLRWSTTSNNTWRAQDEIVAQQSYKSLGIDLRIVNYDGSTYFGRILPKGQFDIGEWENGLVADPDITIASYFASTQLPPKGSNWGHYVNPAYDRLIAAEESTTNVKKRKAILVQ